LDEVLLLVQYCTQQHGLLVASRDRVRLAQGRTGTFDVIDMLVETGAETSAWFPAGLILDLEQALGRRVEVVTERALHPQIRELVHHEAQPLLSA
jgi:predicted nucleotidyltransferase